MDKDYESAVESEDDQPFLRKKKEKKFVMKYRVIQIKGSEVGDNDTEKTFQTATGEIDIKQFTLISLKKDVFDQLCSDAPVDKDDLNQIFMNIHKQKPNRNCLVDLLATKQRLIPFSTSQDSHLHNNLS